MVEDNKVSNQVNWNTTKLQYAIEQQYLFSNGCRCSLTYVYIFMFIFLIFFNKVYFYNWAQGKMLSSYVPILHTKIVVLVMSLFYLKYRIKLSFSDLKKLELRNNKYWALSNIIIMKRFYIKYWINRIKLHISHLALFCLTCD